MDEIIRTIKQKRNDVLIDYDLKITSIECKDDNLIEKLVELAVKIRRLGEDEIT